MPWQNRKGFERSPKKEIRLSGVDKLPLVNAPEPTGTSTPPNGHVSATNSISSTSTPVSRPQLPRSSVNKKSSLKRTSTKPRDPGGPHITTVSISSDVHLEEGGQNNDLLTTPVSYEKNKTVRIAVTDHHVSYDLPQTSSTGQGKKNNRRSRTSQEGDISRSDGQGKDGGTKVSRVESVLVSKNDADGWVRAPSPGSSPVKKHTVEADTDVTVTPIIIDSWRGGPLGTSSHGGSLMDEAASSDDCQLSTSTLVNGSNKFKGDSSQPQRGLVSIICGASIILGSAAVLRLPGLVIMYGPGTFLSCFIACLMILVCPLAYLSAGLAQFNSSGVIGMWSLVPLARGIGWSTVIICLYWASMSMAMSAPSFQYILQLFFPEIIPITTNCELQANSSTFDAVDYYKYCVYNLDAHKIDYFSGLDFRMTWCLPAAVAIIFVFSSISLLGGPVLFSVIVGFATLITASGHGIQLYLSLDRMVRIHGYTSMDQWINFLKLFIPQLKGFLNPYLWIGALSQVLLTIGPGTGMLINHAAHNAFRHSIRKHLWFLTIFSLFTTILISFTTVAQLILLSKRSTSLAVEFVNKTNYTFSTFEELNETLSSDVDTIVSNSDCFTSIDNLGNGSCKPVAGLTLGFPFISSSYILSTLKTEPWWIHRILYVLTFSGFITASITTLSNCLFVGLVSTKEARSIHRILASFLLLTLLAIVTAPLITQSGAALLEIIDSQILTPGILLPITSLTIALGLCHGFCRIRKDLTFMTEALLSWVWVPIWAILPVSYLSLLGWCIYTDWKFWILADGKPLWCYIAVWAFRIGVFIPIPITATIVINSQLAYGVVDKIKAAMQSSREWGEWGPKDPIEHHNWRQWREDETRSYASLERRLAKAKPLSYTHSTLSSTGSSTLNRLRAKYKENGNASDL